LSLQPKYLTSRQKNGNHVTFRILLLLILLIFFALPVVGKDVLIESQSYDYDRKNELHLYRSPRVQIDTLTISGQSAEYSKQTNIITFHGNIIIYSDAMILTADRAVFDLNTSIYTLYNATFFDQKNGAYGTAEKMEQVSDGKYIIHHGEITTCNPKDKSWEMNSSRIVYQVDDFAYSVNSVVFFYSIPIFYTPFLSWPTKAGRSSGVLPPVFMQHTSSDPSKAYGARLQIPYFIALDRDHDLTVTADLIERRGLGIDLDYQYAFVEGMYGILKGWYLDETVKDRDLEEENLGNLSKDDDRIDLQPTRYKYTFNHRQTVFWGGVLTFNQAQYSDNEIDKEYFDLSTNLNPQFRQAADLSFPLAAGSVSIAYNTTSNFTQTSVYDTATDADTYLNQHPWVAISQQFSTIAGTPLSLTLNGDWIDYDRVYGWNSLYTTGSVKVSAPFAVDFLNIAPSYRRTFYRHQATYHYRSDETATTAIDDYPEEFGWQIDDRQLALSFEVFRYFMNDNDEKTAKLSFIPSVTYRQVDDVEQATPADFAIGSTITSQNSISYQLASVYKVKNLNTNSVRDFIRLTLTQPYDLNSVNCAESETDTPVYCVKNHPATPEVEIGEQQLPLRITMVVNPTDRLSGSLFYRYHHQLNKIVETQISLGSTYLDGGSFSLSYIDNTQSYYDLENTSHAAAKTYSITNFFPLAANLKLSVYGKWDQARSNLANRFVENSSVERLDRELTDFSTALVYKHPCYNLSVTYSEIIDTNTVNSLTKEYLNKKFAISLTIPFIPNAASSVLGELPYHHEIKLP
jgi:lipopolysaccharide export system protein LptA